MTVTPSQVARGAELPPLREHVAGVWATPALIGDAYLTDASTATRLQPRRASDDAACARALDAAVHAHAAGFGTWSATRRAEALDAIAEEVDARAEAIAWSDAITTGVLLTTTRALATLAARCFRAAAALARERAEPSRVRFAGGICEVRRLPRGPAVVIAPWNAPSAIAAHKLASALAAGCPVLLKPSEYAPLSSQLLVEACAAHLPAGAVQLLHGGPLVSSRLVADDRSAVVSFTGGLAGGRAVAAWCAHAMKPVQLELGGSNPFVVLASADVERAADALVAGLTTLNGQWCRAVGRIVVDRAVAGALRSAVVDRLAALRIGPACDPDSQMGPLAHADHLATVRAAIACHRGEIIAPTRVPVGDGYFLSPTLLADADGRDGAEIFGPVATVHQVSGAAEALAVANHSPFGLAAYLFGDDDEAAVLAPALRVGGVQVNRLALTSAHPLLVRPAWGLSGLGDEGVIETFEHFRGARTVTTAVPGD